MNKEFHLIQLCNDKKHLKVFFFDFVNPELKNHQNHGIVYWYLIFERQIFFKTPLTILIGTNWDRCDRWSHYRQPLPLKRFNNLGIKTLIRILTNILAFWFFRRKHSTIFFLFAFNFRVFQIFFKFCIINGISIYNFLRKDPCYFLNICN